MCAPTTGDVCAVRPAKYAGQRGVKAKSDICVPPPQAMSASNKMPKSASSAGSYDLSEANLSDELHGWRCVGTSNPIVNGIEESNEEIENSPQPQFDDEWVARGDPYMGVFKCFSYSHSSYVS